MVVRLTGRRWGGKRRKEKTSTRNGGVEEAGSFKKNGPVLYFSPNDYLLLLSPHPPLSPKKQRPCCSFRLIVKAAQDVLSANYFWQIHLNN